MRAVHRPIRPALLVDAVAANVTVECAMSSLIQTDRAHFFRSVHPVNGLAKLLPATFARVHASCRGVEGTEGTCAKVAGEVKREVGLAFHKIGVESVAIEIDWFISTCPTASVCDASHL